MLHFCSVKPPWVRWLLFSNEKIQIKIKRATLWGYVDWHLAWGFSMKIKPPWNQFFLFFTLLFSSLFATASSLSWRVVSEQEIVSVYMTVENFGNLQMETLKWKDLRKGGSNLHTIKESTIM